jgi:hypothetical protein
MIVADIWMFATSERIEFQPAEMDIFKEKKKKRKKSKGIDRMSKKRRAMNLAFLLFIGWLEEKYFREKHSCRKQAVRLMEDSRRTSSPDRNIVGDSKTLSNRKIQERQKEPGDEARGVLALGLRGEWHVLARAEMGFYYLVLANGGTDRVDVIFSVRLTSLFQ